MARTTHHTAEHFATQEKTATFTLSTFRLIGSSLHSEGLIATGEDVGFDRVEFVGTLAQWSVVHAIVTEMRERSTGSRRGMLTFALGRMWTVEGSLESQARRNARIEARAAMKAAR